MLIRRLSKLLLVIVEKKIDVHLWVCPLIHIYLQRKNKGAFQILAFELFWKQTRYFLFEVI